MEAATAARAELREELRLLSVRDDAWDDPKALINEIRYFDPVTQLWVEFKMFPPEGWKSPITREPNGDLTFADDGAQDWYWQSVIIDWLHDPDLHAYLIYKARQLGITLIACAYALWLMLYRPGTAAAAFSYEEGEAKKLVEAVWAMFQSLPPELRNEVTVITPSRGDLPAEWIKLRHADGRISSFQALPATERHGHGARITFGIMDEVAKQKYARRVYEAIAPATLSRGGKLALISTADGVSNLETGEGSFFHHMYATKKDKGLRYVFLPWSAEPTRDRDWYERVAMKLPEVERNRQYPLNEHDGFVMSGEVYFDRGALDFYRKNVKKPLITGQFFLLGKRIGEFRSLRDGVIEVYERPTANGHYAMGVDAATGRASDYTSADVIDLSTGAIVAHFHARIEAPRAAFQLHFLGKWFNTAKIAVERQGGFGDALIIALRDGNANVPPYPNLYRHRRFTSGRKQISDEFGIPMSSNRPALLGYLKSLLFHREFPWMTADHMFELETFIYASQGTSPRAQQGCHDDCVLSLAIACEMYRQLGTHAAPKRKPKKSTYTPSPIRSF